MTGEAGPGLAWALAAVSMLSVLIAVAAPRELAAVQDSALRRAMAALPALNMSVTAQASWQLNGAGNGVLLPDGARQLSGLLAGEVRPVPVAAAGQWASVFTTPLAIQNPTPRAVLSNLPTMEVVYRSQLASYARLVTGKLPGAVRELAPRPGARHGVLLVDAAVTPLTARRLGLHPGSLAKLNSYLPGRSKVWVRVTGIVAPRQPDSPFWQTDPTVAAPVIPLPTTGPDAAPPYWQSAALVGPAEMAQVQAAYAGSIIHGQWFTPLDRGAISQATLPGALAHLNGLVTSNGGPALMRPLPAISGVPQGETTILSVSTGFPAAISGFEAQQRAAAALETLLITNVLLAGLLVVLTCARLAASGYRPELALIRARGGSARQVAGRVLARSACLAGPGAVAGAAVAVAITPAPPDGSPAAWLLGGLAAVAAAGIPALAAGWAHRRIRPATGGRADLVTARSSWRRLVAELTLLVLAGATLAAGRLRGIGSGTDALSQAAPVLAAAAAALIAARLYPVPVRGLLRLAAGRPGPVGFLALARAARARIGALLPALTLVISLTLAAFGVMIVGSVTYSQAAAAWRQAGADVAVQAPLNTVVPAALVRAVAAVPGVRHVTAAVALPGHGKAGSTLQPGGQAARPVGVVVAQPASYAALAGDTPWPDFAAAPLSRAVRTGPPGTAVPVLASAGLGRIGGHGTLVVGGNQLPVTIAGRTGPTAAMTAGTFVILPAWAAARLSTLPGPDLLLASGTGISPAAVRAAVRHAMPGGLARFRTQILAGLRSAPAPRAAAQLYWLSTGVAALLSVIALLFGLALTRQSRGQLIDQLTALGIGSRQARAVAVSEVLPLLAVAVGGTAVAGLMLAAVLGPALNLAVFTGAAGPVRVGPSLAAALPAAGIVVLGLAVVSAQSAAFLRRNVAAMLRQDAPG
jgi:putative ABC transport system permease protein